jgi:hypothetical protein
MQALEAAEARTQAIPSSLRVPKATGTHGDTLIAWGLALLSFDVLNSAGLDCGIELRDESDVYSLRIEVEDEEAEDEAIFTIHRASWLKWLVSTDKGKAPHESYRGRTVDRDQLRADWERLRALRGQNAPVEGDAPVTIGTDAHRYPLYQVLTNPGTQWAGYNSLVEALAPLMSEAGWQLILDMYHPTAPLGPEEIDARLRALGVTSRGSRWRNPPGFLFPGLNKGSTMLLRTEAGTLIGNASSDWMMSDRGDRSIVELYLAYLGYFGFAQVLTSREERVVVVPAPWRVQITRARTIFNEVDLRYSNLHPYMESMAALRYAGKVAQYLRELLEEDPDDFEDAGTVLTGVHITHYWMPSGNTYAPRYTGTVPMPRWLGPLRDEDVGMARDTVEYHQSRLRQIRGRGDDSKLPEERREAIRLYERSLDGDAADWFHAVASWYPAGREAEPENVGKYLWHREEVRRIAVAVKPEISEVIDSEAFTRVAQAIRNATVTAQRLSRKDRAVPEDSDEAGVPGESPFSPQYDLVTALIGAADRHKLDFLQELYKFAARFNDEAMRPSTQKRAAYRPARIRAEDLEQITGWVLAEKERVLIPFALLAFGTSRRGNQQAETPQDGATESESDATDPTGEDL